ncbi:MAG: phage tail tape measure protein [Bacteroidales bacterium]|nr:phage tail tape measure protein [Bacteroidales bacterium]
MAQTKIEMLLALKDRYSAVLKRADQNTETATQRMKRKLGEVKERFKEAGTAIKTNTEAAFTDVKKCFTDSTYLRASVLVAVKNLQRGLEGVKNKAKEAFEELQNKVPIVKETVEFLKNPITIGVGVAAGIGAAFKNAANLAMDWQKGMAQINVTADLPEDELNRMSNKMLDVGAKFSAPLEDVPAAFNKIISAGLTANQALEVLEPTLKAAKAGFVDVETVASAGVNVMNSSGRSIDAVYDILFGTLQKGAASMGEIAAYLPTVVPTAKNAGASLEETAGAFAFLTAQGQNAASAATLLNGAFNSLSNPKLLSNFKAMGVQIYDAKGKMKPMSDIIESLGKKLDGLSDKKKAAKLASLGLDQTSAQAFAVMTQNVQKFKDTLDSVNNSDDALENSFNIATTAKDSWGIALNNIKVFAIKVGQAFLPVITKMGEWAATLTGGIIPAIKGVKDFISEWSPVILGIAAAFLVLNANTIAASAAMAWHSVVSGIAAAKQWILNVAMSANPIGLIIVGIGILIGSIVMLCKKYEGWTSVWNFVKTFLVNSFWQFVDDWKDGFQGLWYYIQLFWLNIKSFGQYIGQLFSNIGQAIKLALTGNFSDAKKMLTSEIHTDAENEIEKLKAEREQQKAKYATETKQRIDETQKAWNDVHLTKKETKSETEGSEDKSVSDDIKDMLGGSTDGGSSPASSGGGSSSVIGSADAVAGSAKQIKNITVNIDAFNKGGINAGNTQGLNGKSAVDLEEWFSQMLLRTIRNLEMSY